MAMKKRIAGKIKGTYTEKQLEKEEENIEWKEELQELNKAIKEKKSSHYQNK